MLDYLVYLLIGLITGISIGIVGIGAGIIMMPLLISYGVSIKTAVAVGLVLQLVPQSLPGVIIYNQNGYVDWILSIYVIIGSLIGITIGAYLVNHKYINKKQMYQYLFIILLFSTLYIGYNFI